jgi:hypothetical protein
VTPQSIRLDYYLRQLEARRAQRAAAIQRRQAVLAKLGWAALTAFGAGGLVLFVVDLALLCAGPGVAHG